MSMREKLSNCLSLAGNQFNSAAALLYQFYIQYIGTEGHGSNIVNNYSRTNNDYNLHRYFCVQYKNKFYFANKLT